MGCRKQSADRGKQREAAGQVEKYGAGYQGACSQKWNCRQIYFPAAYDAE